MQYTMKATGSTRMKFNNNKNKITIRSHENFKWSENQ